MLLKPFKRFFFILIFTALFSSAGAWAQIEITAPKNADAIIAGKTVLIEWSGAAATPVSLFYSIDSLQTWTLIADGITAQSYLWTVPEIAGKKAVLKAEAQKKGDLEKIWEIASSHPEAHQQEIRSGVFSSGGKFILSGSISELKIWDIILKKSETFGLENDGRLLTPKFLHDENIIVYGVDSGIVILKKDVNQKTTLGYGIFTSIIRAIAVHPFKNIVAAAETNGAVRIWDVDAKRELAVFKETDFSAYTIAFSHDGAQIVYAGENSSLLKSRIYVRNWENSSGFTTLEGHGNNGENRTVWSVNFSPDGKRIVSGGVDKTVRIWNIEKVSEEKVLKNHTFHVRAVQFSPDGNRVISGALDSTLRQWDWRSGAEVTNPVSHRGQIISVNYSPTGDTILTTGRDRTIKLWKNTNSAPENSTVALAIIADTVCAADKRQTAFGEKTAMAIFPNPASELARISFTLAEDGVTSLKIIDMQGNLLKTFFTESFKSGRYERDLNLAGISNGVYMVRLETPSQTIDAQISIVK